MKKLAKVAERICFWSGHFWSRGVMYFDFMGWTYPVYNTLMGWSYQIDKEYELGRWTISDD